MEICAGSGLLHQAVNLQRDKGVLRNRHTREEAVQYIEASLPVRVIRATK